MERLTQVEASLVSKKILTSIISGSITSGFLNNIRAPSNGQSSGNGYFYRKQFTFQTKHIFSLKECHCLNVNW